MMTLDEARGLIGEKVVYRPPHVPDDKPGEEGVITSVSTYWAFVRYTGSAHSVATPVERLSR